MPLGENIGQAYIRIHADGSGIPGELRDDLNDADSDIEAAGNRHSKMYDKAWKKQEKRATRYTAMKKALIGAVAEGDYLRDEFFNGNAWNTFVEDSDKRWGEVGQRAAANLKRELQEGMTFEEFESRIKNFRREIAQTTRQIQGDEDRFARDWADAHIEQERRIKQAQDDRMKRFRTNLELLNADLERFNDRNQRPGLLRQIDNLRNSMGDLGDGTRETDHQIRLWNDSLNDTDRRLRRTHPSILRFNRQMTAFADIVGQSTGRGSRNDFINIIGSMTRGMALLPTVATRAAGALLNYRERLRETGGGMALFSRLGGDVLDTAGYIAKGFAGVTLTIGPMVSLLSMAAGAITALASTIGMGLAGAGAALVGSMLPAVGLIGGLGLAIAGIKAQGASNELSMLASDFRALRAEFTEMVFPDFGSVVGRLSNGMRAIRPMLLNVGQAIQETINGTFQVFSGPAGQDFLAAMTDFLPEAVGSMGRIFNNTIAGMMGWLRSLNPLTQRFLTWVEDVTLRFSEFTNSADGQDRLLRFFQDAGDSAAELGDFLGAVWDWLGEIMNLGNEAGDTIFGNMTSAIEGWTASIRANPEPMRQWFNDAVDFASAVGGVTRAFGRLFDALDTETSRNILGGIFAGVEAIINGVASALRPFNALIEGMNGAMDGLGTAVLGAALIMPRLTKAMSGVSGAVTGFISSTRTFPGKMAAISSAAKGAAGIGGLAAFTLAAGSSNDAVRTLGMTAGAAATGFAMGGPWGAAIGGAVGLLGSLFGANQEASSAVEGLTATLDKQTGAVTGNTKEWINHELISSGAAQAARDLGLDMNLVQRAALGNTDAQKQLNEQLAAFVLAGEQADSSKPGYGALIRNAVAAADLKGKLDGTNSALGKAKNNLQLNAELNGKAAGAAGRNAGAQGNLAGKLRKTASAASQVNDNLTRLNGWLDKRASLRNYESSIDNLTKSVKDNGKNFDINTEKGRNNEAALDDIARSAGQYASQLKGANKIKFMEGAESRLRKVAGDLGLPKKATQEVIDKLHETGRVKTDPKVTVDTSAANSSITALEYRMNHIPDETVYVNVYEKRHGKATARGGMFNFAQTRLIGEAGPEAVVPLNRPLGQVDPAVRWLSAIAQGKALPGMASGGVVGGGGRTVDVGGITVVSPQSDPRAVAAEVVNHLVAVGY